MSIVFRSSFNRQPHVNRALLFFQNYNGTKRTCAILAFLCEIIARKVTLTLLDIWPTTWTTIPTSLRSEDFNHIQEKNNHFKMVS